MSDNVLIKKIHSKNEEIQKIWPKKLKSPKSDHFLITKPEMQKTLFLNKVSQTPRHSEINLSYFYKGKQPPAARRNLSGEPQGAIFHFPPLLHMLGLSLVL